MAKSEHVIYLEWDTQSISAGFKEISGTLGGLKKVLGGLQGAVARALDWSAVIQTMGKSLASAEALEKELLILRLRLGSLKAAFADAVTPLAAVMIPVLNQGVLAATRLVRAVGQVIGALFAGADANGELRDNAQEATKAEKALASSAGKVKRSLAGFDQITRLNGAAGGAGNVQQTVSAGSKVKDQLSPKLQSIVDKIQSLLQPLKSIDLSGVIRGFGLLRETIEPIGKELFSGLEWAWHNLLVPLASWSIENVLPAFLELLSSALQVLSAVLTALKPLALWLWEQFLLPIAQWTGGVIVQVLQQLTEKLKGVSQWIQENQSVVQAMTVAVLAFMAAWGGGQIVKWTSDAGGLLSVLGNLTSGMGLGTLAASAFQNGLRTLAGGIGVAATAVAAVTGAVSLLERGWNAARTAAVSAWDSICNVWGRASAWITGNVLDPLERGCRKAVNGVIGVINGLLSGVAGGVNGVVKALNKIRFQFPNWVPGLGGESFGLNLQTVTVPQIPYLAKGAVLPANKPFMAVVGDQRHGTNVEAPLQTIQEAVAVVMDEFIQANMTGHEATVQTLQQILQAVLGIQIGDEVIGRAATRYGQKMAVVRGG